MVFEEVSKVHCVKCVYRQAFPSRGNLPVALLLSRTAGPETGASAGGWAAESGAEGGGPRGCCERPSLRERSITVAQEALHWGLLRIS